jgi:hypothetical protein
MTPRQNASSTARGLEGSSEDLEQGRAVKKQPKEKITPVGVYLDKDMREAINRIVKKQGVKRHALLQYAILYFLNEYEKDPGILEFEKRIKKP